jgi:hypothetical protein
MGASRRRPSTARASKTDDVSSGLKSARIEAALQRAVDLGETADLFDLLARSARLSGPRPNLELARALGLAIARHAGRADRLLRSLLDAPTEFPRIVAALALGARSLAGVDPRGALAGLEQLAEDPRHLVRTGVATALRLRIAALGEAAVAELDAWTSGYLQAHVALSALSDRATLDALPAHAPVLARLEEAFALADAAPRAADRSQGLRALRSGLPAQITAFAARFPETLVWLEQAAAQAKRPETRAVVADAIRTLHKARLSDADASRLTAALEASAPPPRDPSRIVQGTRKRSHRFR